MSDRRESLVKNTALFAIGNLGSKILQIVLVPYYTRVMNRGEFGVADIIQAVVALLMPIFSLTIYEGVFRFAMERQLDRKGVFTTGVLVSVFGSLLLCVIGGICTGFVLPKYVWLTVANTISVIFRSLLSQYARAINRIGLFTVDNLLITAMVLALNIVFITVLDWGVIGYILGYTLANVFSCLILWLWLGKERKISIRKFDGMLACNMLLYSVPLIPNTICWWISSFVDRVIITSQFGGAANGLYAAAHKIPSLLTVVITVFFQAWQISANAEFKKRDIAAFYTEIHNQIFASICVLSSLLIVLCRPITDVFLGADYAVSWIYMPVLLLAMTFFSFAQFLGSIYSANMRTGMALVTNLIAVVVNLLLNFVLIERIGVIGAGVATACSYFVLWMIRIRDTKKIVLIRYQVFPMVAATFILIMQTILATLDIHNGITYGVGAGCVVLLVILFRKTFIDLLRFIVQLCKRMSR